MLLGKLEIVRERGLVRHHPHTGVLSLDCGLDVVPGGDVDQEVELVILSDGLGYIITM